MRAPESPKRRGRGCRAASPVLSAACRQSWPHVAEGALRTLPLTARSARLPPLCFSTSLGRSRSPPSMQPVAFPPERHQETGHAATKRSARSPARELQPYFSPQPVGCFMTEHKAHTETSPASRHEHKASKFSHSESGNSSHAPAASLCACGNQIFLGYSFLEVRFFQFVIHKISPF